MQRNSQDDERDSEPIADRPVDAADLTTYVDIIEFIGDVLPLVGSGLPIPVVVDGTDTGADRRVTGTVASIDYLTPRIRTDGPPTYTDLAGMKTVTIDAGDELVAIGGRAATEEDIELRRIAIAAQPADLLDLFAQSTAGQHS